MGNVCLSIGRTLRWLYYRFGSPYSFKNPDTEYEFMLFFYGKEQYRFRPLFSFGLFFWVVLTYTDFTDYKNVSKGLRIANFVLRGVGAFFLALGLLFYFRPVRRRLYLVEFITVISGTGTLAVCAIKHSFKNDITLFPSIVQLVAWAIIGQVGVRFWIAASAVIVSWLSYIIALPAVFPGIVKEPYYYAASAFTLISFTSYMIQNLYREKEFRVLFLSKKKLETASEQVRVENERSKILLKNIFPRHFVENEALRGERFVQTYDNLVVLVHDLVSFTNYSSTVSGEVLVQQLNHHFSAFETLAKVLNLEKLKSAGDSLTLIAMDGESGVSRCVFMGHEMILKLKELNAIDKTNFSMRVGVAMGKGFLAVMGADQMEFDGFGHVMMFAEEMEQTSQENRVHVTKVVRDRCLDLFEFEEAPPVDETETYHVVQPKYSSKETFDILAHTYERELMENGLPSGSINDKFTNRISIQKEASSVSIFGLKAENHHTNNSPSDTSSEVDSITSKSITRNRIDECKKKYKPNILTTLFSSLSVTKEFLTKSYKKRTFFLKLSFFVMALMQLVCLASLTMLFPEVYNSYSQIVRYTLTFVTVFLTACFILIPPWSRIPLVGAFTNIAIALFMTIFMYSILFERQHIVMVMGDQGLIFLIWSTFSTFALPWLVKSIMLFVFCFLYIIPFTVFGKFFPSFIIVFIAFSLMNVLVFHSIHYAIAKAFSSNRILKQELKLLREEEKRNTNIMRSVVPDKLVLHLKTWVERHFDEIVSRDAEITGTTMKEKRSLFQRLIGKRRRNRINDQSKLQENLEYEFSPFEEKDESQVFLKSERTPGRYNASSNSHINSHGNSHGDLEVDHSNSGVRSDDFDSKKKDQGTNGAPDMSVELKSRLLKSYSRYALLTSPDTLYDDLHIYSFIPHGTSLFLYLTNYHTLIAESETPIDLISQLHELFSFYDSIIEHFGCTKVKWKGCTYIAIAGSDGKPDHVQAMVKAAVYMLDVARRFFQGSKFANITCQIGLDSGTFYEALVGTTKFRQDYFSDTLNISSRMASTAQPNSIQFTRRVYEVIKDDFSIVSNGEKMVKGKGTMETFSLH